MTLDPTQYDHNFLSLPNTSILSPSMSNIQKYIISCIPN